MGPGMTLDITEITPAARISSLFIIGTVLSSSPERMVKSSPQSRRVLAMLSKSPVASLTWATLGYWWARMAKSSTCIMQPVRPGMM